MTPPEHVRLSWHEVEREVRILASRRPPNVTHLHGVPSGGTIVALLLHRLHPDLTFIGSVGLDRAWVVDDLVDSGRTLLPYAEAGHAVDALYRKAHSPDTIAYGARTMRGWLAFPWEKGTDGPPIDAVERLLQYVGEDPTREGLRETPARVCRALREMTSGHAIDVEALLARTFDANGYDEVVLLKGIPFASLCEHHLLPFSGIASVAYLPKDRIVGLSKLGRVVQAFAQRLQVQERLTVQVADAIEQALQPRGVAVVLMAHHSCMGCRGARLAGDMVTSRLTGAFRNDPAARAEVLGLAR